MQVDIQLILDISSQSSSQTILKVNFLQKIYFEVSVVWDLRNRNVNKNRNSVQTILF